MLDNYGEYSGFIEDYFSDNIDGIMHAITEYDYPKIHEYLVAIGSTREEVTKDRERLVLIAELYCADMLPDDGESAQFYSCDDVNSYILFGSNIWRFDDVGWGIEEAYVYEDYNVLICYMYYGRYSNLRMTYLCIIDGDTGMLHVNDNGKMEMLSKCTDDELKVVRRRILLQ